jgi:hypothetical protein
MLLALSLMACATTCEQACQKLTSCSELEVEGRYAEECAEVCSQQETLYDDWEDTQLADALQASKECVTEHTCEELDDGVCYDEELWPY